MPPPEHAAASFAIIVAPGNRATTNTSSDALHMSALKFGHAPPKLVHDVETLQRTLRGSPHAAVLVLRTTQAIILAPPEKMLKMHYAHRDQEGVPRLLSSTASPGKSSVVNLMATMGEPRLLAEAVAKETVDYEFKGVPELAVTLRARPRDVILPHLATIRHSIHEEDGSVVTINGLEALVLALPHHRASEINYFAYHCGVSDNSMASYAPYGECIAIWCAVFMVIVVIIISIMWFVAAQRHRVPSTSRT